MAFRVVAMDKVINDHALLACSEKPRAVTQGSCDVGMAERLSAHSSTHLPEGRSKAMTVGTLAFRIPLIEGPVHRSGSLLPSSTAGMGPGAITTPQRVFTENPPHQRTRTPAP